MTHWSRRVQIVDGSIQAAASVGSLPLQMTPRDAVITLDDAVKMVREHTKE